MQKVMFLVKIDPPTHHVFALALPAQNHLNRFAPFLIFSIDTPLSACMAIYDFRSTMCDL